MIGFEFMILSSFLMLFMALPMQKIAKKHFVYNYIDFVLRRWQKTMEWQRTALIVDRLTEETVKVLKTFQSIEWQKFMNCFLTYYDKLIDIYASKKKMTMMPVKINGANFKISAGKHNEFKKTRPYLGSGYLIFKEKPHLCNPKPHFGMAIVYRIAETAKANSPKPYGYFENLLTEIPRHL